MLKLNAVQRAAVAAGGRTFLLGPAGTGKSAALHARLVRLLADGEPAYTILVLVAEPEHVAPFQAAVQQAGIGPHADLKITPYQAMARELLTLFWPLVARPAGFERPYQPPTFLGYDLAQLLMWRIVTPMIAQGAFAGLHLRPQQIVSQLLDTLNRASLNALTLDQAIARQKSTWAGPADGLRHWNDAALAARDFRAFCLQNNLLDLSLLVQVFDTQLVRHPDFRRYFRERYRHLLVDNVEEQTPAGQNFVAGLMDATESTTIAYDAGGGYKRFLAADPAGSQRFHDLCEQQLCFEHSFTSSPALDQLSSLVENALLRTTHPAPAADQALVAVVGGRYRQEMVSNLVELLAARIHRDGLPADQVAIIAPYLDGALRYMLAAGLAEAGLPYFLLRRRSSPRDEPHVRAWLTWLALAHPDWDVAPQPYDVAEALHLSLAGLDPVRASLVAQHLYPPGSRALRPVDALPAPIAGRVGAANAGRVEELRAWLDEHGHGRHPPDVFLYRLFHELLGQPRFQPEPDAVGAAICDWLVRTATRLRQAANPMGLALPADIGATLISGVYQGLVTAGPPEMGEPPDTDGVMITTIYGYLLAGRPVHLQVWLEAAASGWWDIPRQPLSNAFVLAQSWPPDRIWTMAEEYAVRNELLSRIVRGLTHRCGGGVILANSDLDRRGLRQDGPLWRALQPALTAFAAGQPAAG